MTMRPTLTIAPPLYTRALRVAAALPVPQARRIVGALVAANAAGSEGLAAKHLRARGKTIDAMTRAFRRQLGYAKAETIRHIEEMGHHAGSPLHAAEGRGVAADIIFDLKRFGRGLLATMRNEAGNGLQRAGEQLWDELGDLAPDDPFEMPDPVARRYLDHRANLLKGVPDEIHSTIMGAIQEGLDDGDSTRDLARRIMARFTGIGQGRARTVASTETAACYGFSRQQGMKQAGIKTKRWLTSHLGNVRATHAAAERDERNQRVPIDQPFHVGDDLLMHPGDPDGSAEETINCHCVSLANAD